MTNSNPRGRLNAVAAILAAALLAIPSVATAQESDEPLLDQLVSTFQTDALTLGALIQSVGHWAEGSDHSVRDGFFLGAARLRVEGVLDGGWSYLFQTEFVVDPVIADARIRYRFGNGFRVDAGRFKTPVSYEFLTYAGSIDFVNRSRAVGLLAPGRQIGAQASFETDQGLEINAGAFSGPTNFGSDDAILTAGRAQWTPAMDEESSLVVGVNGAWGRNEALSRALFEDDFTGDGWVAGADLRYTRDRLLLAGEFLANRLTPTKGNVVEARGHHVTAGWMFTEEHQGLARWDRFRGIEGGTDDALVLGGNWWPTGATEVQVNWVVPLSGDESVHRLWVNLQLGF